jgi:DNA-binding transcriptional MocR family regulator
MSSEALRPGDAGFAYERLARDIASAIDRGALPPGTRLPSVRAASRRRGVSVATVMAGYEVLQRRGLITARPRSGFFVTAREAGPAALPRPGTPVARPRVVAISDLLRATLEAVGNPRLVDFGAAVPDPAFLPVAALTGRLAGAARRAPVDAVAALPPFGLPALREAIAWRATEAGMHAGPKDVIVTAGGAEALALCLQAVTRPGDTVAVESPTYFGTLQALEALRLRALELPTDPRDGLAPTAAARAFRSGRVRACVLTPLLQNPLGACMPEPAKAALIDAAVRHGVTLIEDDTFRDLAPEPARVPALQATAPPGTVLRFGSFSKTLAPGFRVGWVMAGPRQEEVGRLKLGLSGGTAMPPQLALAEYLGGSRYDRHLGRLRAVLLENRVNLAADVARYFPEGTRIAQPIGGFLLWVELPSPASALPLAAEALAHGIAVMPGSLFSTTAAYDRYLRLSAAAPWTPRAVWAVRRLGELARRLRRCAATTG